jgi:hypothetical protein
MQWNCTFIILAQISCSWTQTPIASIISQKQDEVLLCLFWKHICSNKEGSFKDVAKMDYSKTRVYFPLLDSLANGIRSYGYAKKVHAGAIASWPTSLLSMAMHIAVNQARSAWDHHKTNINMYH